MLDKSRGCKASVLQGLVVFPKVMIQGPACLADLGAGTFGTRDAVHHSLQFAGTVSFRCASYFRRVLKGWKLTWIARGANTPRMDSDNHQDGVAHRKRKACDPGPLEEWVT